MMFSKRKTREEKRDEAIAASRFAYEVHGDGDTTIKEYFYWYVYEKDKKVRHFAKSAGRIGGQPYAQDCVQHGVNTKSYELAEREAKLAIMALIKNLQ